MHNGGKQAGSAAPEDSQTSAEPVTCPIGIGTFLIINEDERCSVNCGAANVTRAQAEKLLGNYFALVEHAIPWADNNPLDRRS
jgi:hypothetical protein